MTEMTDNRLRWVMAAFVIFMAVCYFTWLCALYVKIMDAIPKPPPVVVDAEVIKDDTD